LGTPDIVNFFQPHGQAPNSAHILWRRPITFGGIADAKFGDISYYEGLTYESKFPYPVIIQGVLYYNEYPSVRYEIDTPPPGFYAVDLLTGETLWWQNGTVTTGQIYDYESPNAHGTIAYLWKIPGSREPPEWYMYDAFNGVPLLTMENMPGGTMATSKDGSILRYVLNTKQGWLALWNSSRAIWSYWAPYSAGREWNWRPPYGGTVDALKDGYSWNVTIPSGLTGSINAVLDDKIIGSSIGGGSSGVPYTVWTLSTKPEQEGQLLWEKSYPAIPDNVTISMGPIGSGVYTIYAKETRQWYCYNLTTGDLMWGPSESQSSLHMYTAHMSNAIAGGKLFSAGWGGIVYCYDVTTGDVLWT
jgi:outer membrane protein assembly factor BamB